MTDKYALALKDAIDELQAVAKSCQDAESIEMDLIEEATKKSHQLLLLINDAAILNDNMLLRELISKLLFVINQLHNLAVEEEKNITPPPHELLAIITSSFEYFFNTTMSKKHQEMFKKVAEFVPCVSSVVYCCETMPYYWAYASRSEKAGMVLGAALIVGALAATIASYTSPGLAGIYVLSMGIITMCRVGTIFYRDSIATPEKKYNDHQRLKDTILALEEQKSGVSIMAKKIFTENKLEQESLDFQKQFVDTESLEVKSRAPMRFPAKIHFSLDRQLQKLNAKTNKAEAVTRRSQNQNGW